MPDPDRSDDEGDPLPYGLGSVHDRPLGDGLSLGSTTRSDTRPREGSDAAAEPSRIGRVERIGLGAVALLHGPADALSTLLAETSGASAETNPLIRTFLYSATDPRAGGSPIADYVLLVGVMVAIAVIGTDLLRRLRIGPIETLREVEPDLGRAAGRLWSLAVASLVGLGIVVVAGNIWIAL